MSGPSVGRAQLDLGVNYKGFNKELQGIAGNAQGMVGGAFKKLGVVVAAAFAVKSLVNFGRASIQLASNLQEVQNVVDVTFGSASAEIDQFAKQAITNFGMSELSAKKFSSTMGAMLKSSGLTGSTMVSMAKDITALTGDMASFYNLDHETAFQKIRAGLSGETEPLKQLGINMSVANLEAFALSKGIRQSYQSMDQANQTMLRHNYLLNATKDAQGDFIRTSGSWANQIRIMSEQWKSFQSTMGSAFITILTPIVRGLNLLIMKLQVAAEYFKAFVDLVFGVKEETKAGAKATEDMSTGLGGVAGGAKKAGKAIKGSLGSFDQLNTLTKQTAESMDDIAGGSAGMDMGAISGGNVEISVDTTKLDLVKSEIDSVIDKVKIMGGYLYEAFGPSVKKALDIMKPEVSLWRQELQTSMGNLGSLWEPFKQYMVNDLLPFLQTQIVNAGIILQGLSESLRMMVADFRVAVFPIIEWFVTNGLPLLMSFATSALELFMTLFNGVKTIFDTLWTDAVAPGLQLLSTMIMGVLTILQEWWYTWGVGIVEKLGVAIDGIVALFNNLWENFLKPIVTTMLETMSWLWEKHLKKVVEEVMTFAGKLIDNALEIFNKFILPIVGWLVEKLGPAFANFVSLTIEVIGTFLGTILDVAGGVIKAFGGITDFITGIFTGNWKKAWEGVATIFSGIFDGIKGVFKGVINVIIDAMNFLIRSLNKIKIDIPEWVPGMGGKEFGFSISQIPKLANGGIITSPTLAMMGEGGKKEAVVPLENSDFIASFAGAVAAAIAGMGGGRGSNDNDDSPAILVLKIGETEFGRIAVKSIKKLQRQTGVAMLSV